MKIAGNDTGVSSINTRPTGMKYQNNRLGNRRSSLETSQRPFFSSPFSSPPYSKDTRYYPDLGESNTALEEFQLATALSKSEHEQQLSLRSDNAEIMEVECEAVEGAGKSLFNQAFNGTRAQSGLFTPKNSPGEVSTATGSDQSCITVMDQSPPQPPDPALINAVEYCKSLAYDAMCENIEDGVIRDGYLSLNQTPMNPAIADCAKRAYERANGQKSRRENDEEECDGPEERRKITRLFGMLAKANA